MSKELEALEKIKNAPTIYVGCASDIYTRYSFECKEIETALKRLEQLEEEKQSFDRKLEKKLKALEIIKEKVPLIYLLAGFVGKYDPEEVEIIKEVYLND